VSAQKLMLVLGATGFLGKFVIDRMLASGYPMRVVTRGGADWRNSRVSSLRQKGVDVIIGDITDDGMIERAVENTSAIVNMLGSFKETGDVSFEDLNVSVVEQLLEHGLAAGVQRMIHVSCLGARPDSDSRYYTSKWEGEELIRNSKSYWTIFRPAFLFGDRFPLLHYLKPVFTFRLFLPVIGTGTNTIQPIFVEDVADCIMQSIYSRQTVGKSFDLVGPDEYQMLEMLEMTRKALGISGPSVNIPSNFSGKTFDMVAKALPRSLLTHDLAGIMGDDVYGSQDEMLANFKVNNVGFEKYFSPIVDSLVG